MRLWLYAQRQPEKRVTVPHCHAFFLAGFVHCLCAPHCQCGRMPVQDQQNGVDCGPLSLAFAYERLQNRAPENAAFSRTVITDWIETCFENEQVVNLKRRGGNARRAEPRADRTITEQDAQKLGERRKGPVALDTIARSVPEYIVLC